MTKSNRHGAAMETMISGWEQYIVAHVRCYQSVIGEDYVLGPEILAIGKALAALLNGELGSLDAGHTWGRIHDALKVAGFPDGLDTIEDA